MKHGHGVYVKPGAERYEGDFKEGQRHGKGRLILPSGEVTQGVWHKGQLEE